jgi:hypothetical protein
MNKFKIIAFIFLWTMTACDGLLDEAPKDVIDPERFYQSETDGVAAITGIYRHLLSPNAFGVQMDILFGVNHDIFGPTRVLGAGQQFLAYRWDANTERFRVIWRELYQAINDANLALERIELSDIQQSAKDDIIGEVLFLRAFVYYYMVAMFGDVPLITEASTGDNFKELGQQGRNPKAAIYQQIIADCERAEELLPSTRSTQKARATKWAAKALKMKTYLWLKDWGGAKAAAQDIIDNSHHKLLEDFEAIFDANNEFNEEIIFQLDYIKDQVSTNRAARFSPRGQDDKIPKNKRPPVFSLGFGFFNMYKSFSNLYAENDKRRSMSVFDELEDGTKLRYTYLPKNWRLNDPRANTGLNYKFYRTADIYLNLAEAENELNGPTDIALNAINAVRERAGLEGLSNSLSQQQLREAIRLERALELAGEGTHRKLDLLRWGTLGEALNNRLNAEKKAPSAKKTNNIKILNLTVNNFQEHFNLCPIPTSEIILNPNLTQNNGY